VDRGMSINFSKGFVDLNPYYHKMRHIRAVKAANRWLEVIKSNLKDKVAEESRKNFNKWISEGNKLTF